MAEYKTVLFDWEGVMGKNDTRPFGWLMNRLPQEYAVSEADAVSALHAAIPDFLRGKVNNSTFWNQVGASLGVTFTKEFQDTIWREWHGADVLPEMEQLVTYVKGLGLRAVVFSNILPTSAARIRELAGYEGFDAEILSCEVGSCKPEPEIYQLALKAAQCLPENCIFIDDQEKNLVPARELGMTTILAVNTVQIIQETKQLVSGAYGGR
ncbi:MAG TPA: HAD family phosphatase [Candidatus Saccharimonadales bacterium]